MDKNTKKILDRITANIPAHLHDVVHDVTDYAEEEIMKQAVKDKMLSSKKAREIERLIDIGAFRKKESVEDQEKIKELDEYFTTMIKKYRKQGLLKDPEDDPWFRARMAKMDKHQ
jgi:hypothetical protein